MGGMTDRLAIFLAQLNPTVGAIAPNLAKARPAYADAKGQAADLVLFSELFLAGYPPEDLVLRRSFVARCMEAARELANDTMTGPDALIGVPWREDDRVFNAVAHLSGGAVATVRY